MGFRKPLYDVEEKGLDPNVPHKALGSDGRLLPSDDSLGTPAAVTSPQGESNPPEVVAAPKSKDAAKTPPPAEKKADTKKEVVDKPQNALKELPNDQEEKKAAPAAKKSPAKKRVSRTRTTKKTSSSKARKSPTKKKSTAKKKTATKSVRKGTKKEE